MLSCEVYGGGKLSQFVTYGFAWNKVLVGHVPPRLGDELLLGSETGSVYILGPDGGVLAERSFRGGVNDIAVLPGETPLIAVACDDGRVYLMGAQTNLLGPLDTGGRMGLVKVLSMPGGPRLLAATTGRVFMLAP